MCRWSLQRVVDLVDLAFDYFPQRLLSVSVSHSLSVTADCVICINESGKREMVIFFSVFSSFPISQFFKTFQHSVFLSLPFIITTLFPSSSFSLFSSLLFPLFRFLSDSPTDRLESYQQGFDAAESFAPSSLSSPPPTNHTHTHTHTYTHQPSLSLLLPLAVCCTPRLWLSNQCSAPP